MGDYCWHDNDKRLLLGYISRNPVLLFSFIDIIVIIIVIVQYLLLKEKGGVPREST